MRIDNIYTNTSKATEFAQGLDNNNVTSYFINYTAEILSNDIGIIQTSEVSLLPTNDSNQRILNVSCFGQIVNLTNNFFVIQFDFSNIQVFKTFSLEQGMEGTFSIHDMNIKYNAGNLLYYVFDDFTRKLDIFVNLKKLKLKLSEFYFSLDIYIQDDIDTSSYFFRRLFSPYEFPYNYTFLNTERTVNPTGEGQTVALLIPWTSGWYAEDIVNALAQNGITKTVTEIHTSIHYVNATYNIPGGFNYKGRIGLQLPLSDGIYSQIPINELPDSAKLSLCLQTIFSAAPDCEIYIFYFGSLVTTCDEEDEDATFEEVRNIVRVLMTQLTQYLTIYDVICNPNNIEIVLSDQGSIELDMQNFLDAVVIQRKKTMFNMSGNNSKSLETIPQVNIGPINCGGTQRLFNSIQNAAFCSSGGLYLSTPVDFPESHIPYYQLGIVTPVIPSDPDYGESFLGVPDIGAFATNMFIFFNKSTVPSAFSNATELSAASMTGLILLINQLTEFREWDYRQIFYWEHEYLFNYVSEGSNDENNANAFYTWNPICGLGWINGTRLANLLSTGFVLSDSPIQISSSAMQKQMSYLNFYPLSPVADPIYLLPTYDFDYSQPVFGPVSIWSQLKFYVVDKLRYKPITPFDGIPINNNDWIMITIETIGQTEWFLRFFGDHVRLVRIEEFDDIMTSPSRQFDTSFFWMIQFVDSIKPLRVYEDFGLSPVNNRNYYLTSEFNAIASAFPSSPSVTGTLSSYCDFKMSPHPYYLVNPDQSRWKVNHDSYFINITNREKFVVSGVTVQNTSSYMIARRFVATGQDPYYALNYGDFDGFPQWLFIPQHPYHDQIDASLKFGKYVLYNNRLQAYMFLLDDNLIFYNANSTTMSISGTFYEFCLFTIDGTNPDITNLFTPTRIPSSGTLITPYLSHVSFSNETPYFTPPYRYYSKISISDEMLPGDNNIVHVSLIPLPPNMYLFWVNTTMILTSENDISLKPPFVANNNNRFLRTNISTNPGNNNIIVMKNLDSTDPSQRWNIIPKNNSRVIQTSALHPEFLILHNFLSTYSFQSVIDQSYISHAGGGPWNPFKSNNENETSWAMFANYLNLLPSQLSTSSFAFANNYLYKNTLFQIDSPKGTLSCCLNGPHVPGLIMQTVDNEDTIIYGSLLYIYKFPN